MNYNLQGFIVRKTALKESDLIIDIFTNSLGLKTVYAFKARSPKSKRRNILEIMNLIEFSISKPKSNNLLPILKEVKINSEFNSIKIKSEYYSSAFILAEVINKVAQQNNPEDSLFNLLAEISKENIDTSPKLLTSYVLVQLLYDHGFISQFNLDLKTSKKLNLTKKIIRSDSEPGYTNIDKAGNYQDENQKIIREIKILNFLVNCKNFRALEKLGLDESELSMILDSILDFIEMVIESKLKSRNLLHS